jgi:N-acetylglucosaminyldiphosphoundecaprenol N-acetyl-beta-D-mannosaminyltransferase
MIDRGRHSVLGVRINAVNYDAATERILSAARNEQPLAVSALAVHGLMTGALDATQRHRLNEIDLLVPDGQPVRWALNRLHGADLRDRVYGPNLMLEVCRRAAEEQMPVFLFGGDTSMLKELAEKLRERLPALQIAGMRASRFRTLDADERSELINEIRQSGAKIVFVGIGCPRQEVFVYELRSALSMPLLAVGAAFPFHAGRLPQAPNWMQRRGLEWLFRLASEPRRLWRRYLYLNPLFVLLLLGQISGLYVIDPESTHAPLQEMCYG